MGVELVDGIKWYVVFLFSTCCHEAAHAWAASRLGDDTALRGGQVTLDPTPHIRREPFGTVVVPLLSFFLGGWMVGWASTPFDPQWASQHPRRFAWMSLAGPAANALLVAASVWLMRIGCEWGVFLRPGHASFLHIVAASGAADGGWSFCAKLVSLVFSLNLLLAAFNLLPVPPLDGRALPLLLLRGRAAGTYWTALRQPTFAWLGLLFAWKIFGTAFPSVFGAAVGVVYAVMPVH